MDRRKAIINLSLSAAGLGFSSSLISALAGCSTPQSPGYEPFTFTADQDALVRELVECIIPTTDTPGAKAAGVNRYIDRVLALVQGEPERPLFLGGLANVEERSRTQFGKKFVNLQEAKQVALLEQLEQESKSAAGLHFFSLLKSMTIFGYYTSEIGATQELVYVHAAGTYNGDMAYSQVGKNYY